MPAGTSEIKNPGCGGFSLIELLTVIAILAILAVASMAAFTNIGRAGNLTKTGNDIGGLLELARAHAMAQNTYVWVGFEEGTDGVLLVGVAASRNGGATPSAADVVQLGPLKRFERVKMVALPDNAPHRKPEDGVRQLTSITSAIFSFTAGSGANATVFDNRVIQFNSLGESRVESGQLYKAVEIGLQKATDGGIRDPENYVALQLGRLSGSVSLYRP